MSGTAAGETRRAEPLFVDRETLANLRRVHGCRTRRGRQIGPFPVRRGHDPGVRDLGQQVSGELFGLAPGLLADLEGGR